MISYFGFYSRGWLDVESEFFKEMVDEELHLLSRFQARQRFEPEASNRKTTPAGYSPRPRLRVFGAVRAQAALARGIFR